MLILLFLINSHLGIRSITLSSEGKTDLKVEEITGDFRHPSRLLGSLLGTSTLLGTLTLLR